jgi:hypothetical protein
MAAKDNKENTVPVKLYIPKELHKALRIKAISQEMFMGPSIIEAIQAWVNMPEPK